MQIVGRSSSQGAGQKRVVSLYSYWGEIKKTKSPSRLILLLDRGAQWACDPGRDTISIRQVLLLVIFYDPCHYDTADMRIYSETTISSVLP